MWESIENYEGFIHVVILTTVKLSLNLHQLQYADTNITEVMTQSNELSILIRFVCLDLQNTSHVSIFLCFYQLSEHANLIYMHKQWRYSPEKMRALDLGIKFELFASLKNNNSKDSACKNRKSADHNIWASITLATLATTHVAFFVIFAGTIKYVLGFAYALPCTPLAVGLHHYVGVLVGDVCRYFEAAIFSFTARFQFRSLTSIHWVTFVALKRLVI